MKIFEIYILRQISRSFFIACSFVIFIAWTIQVLRQINLISYDTESLTVLFKISYNIIPTIFPMVIPFCFAMESTNILTSMNKNAELLIVDNTGTSRITLIKPVLLLATLLSVFLFISENSLEPKCRAIIKQISARAQLTLLFSALEENSFFEISDQLYVEISKYNRNNTLQGIFVVDARNTQMHNIYYALNGFLDLDKKSIILQDGETHRKSPLSNEISIIKFKSYTLAMQSPNSTQTIALKAPEHNLSFLLNPDPNNPSYQTGLIGTYRAELHKRLTQWLFPIIFGLISIIAADKRGSMRQRSKIHPIFISLSMSFGFFGGFSYIINGIEKNPGYIPLLYLFLFCTSSTFIFMIQNKYTKI
ncbi:LptF/LptG family permease [Candidatus Liberibacter africanus]|uniref:Permease n=1 Tax=Candidatus Liberibacter africanus PTSAPSY TaxID=1277257 RepID=A0A0G3I265_LIBAF|nr:LptF/LptG family permease [Candidatus Liberibacter africanus]AKK19946.1 permease [Candidatus Liberibacter africanus PTSAPSY]QTP63786.1 LptF/LptG family permease [Candidatus Liberibacter africanus]